MRRAGPEARRGPFLLAGAAPAGGRALIAGIVLALLLIGAVFAALLYGAGAFRDGSLDPFNVSGTAPASPVGNLSAKPS